MKVIHSLTFYGNKKFVPMKKLGLITLFLGMVVGMTSVVAKPKATEDTSGGSIPNLQIAFEGGLLLAITPTFQFNLGPNSSIFGANIHYFF